MSSKILQWTVGSRDLSQAEQNKILLLQAHTAPFCSNLFNGQITQKYINQLNALEDKTCSP